MKIGLIAPDSLLKRFGVLQDFHLVLAHRVRENELYQSFYRERARLGDFVTLDNGAFELGHSIEDADLLDIAEMLKVNEVVIPDVMYETEATYTRVEAFLELVTERYGSIAKAPFQFMLVPQAESWEAWVEHYPDFVSRYRKNKFRIGVPKWLADARKVTASEELRFQGLGRISLLNHLDRSLGHHFLGLHNFEELRALRIVPGTDFITTLDTSAPFAAAVHSGHPTSNQIESQKTISRPENYFRLAASDFETKSVNHNVLSILSVARSTP